MGLLDGKVAIVTGASRGIGAAIARRLGAEGAAVSVVARTTEPGGSQLPGSIAETADQIRATGGTAIALTADVSQRYDRLRLVSDTTRQLGSPDILVNNAAVSYFLPVENFTPNAYELMFAVQVDAPMQLATLVLPGMRERGAGWILNISSRAACHPAVPPADGAIRGGTIYGMCKAALERLSTGLAAELYPDNIAVNALSPSRVVPTPGAILHKLASEDDPEAEPPEVIAEAALMLCGADPRSRTGRIAYSADLLAELGVSVPAPGQARRSR
jgi:citronellol/citronellal dehydrogenase